jgi:hypothetical protein
MLHNVAKYNRQSARGALRNLSGSGGMSGTILRGLDRHEKERTDMSYRIETRKIMAAFLSLLTLSVTLPFSLAETVATRPLGVILITGTANVGGNSAPAGTSLFPGDRITASSDPVLINFLSGSRIQMTNAAATFGREGKRLIVQASNGLFRFHFTSADGVQIDAGRYRFVADSQMPPMGELWLNQNGEVMMTLSQGGFTMINLATGERSKVTADQPLLATGQTTQPKARMSGMAVAGLVAGVGGGAAAIGLTLIKPPPKSPSSR